jgi:hypothetical protein
MKHSVNKQIKGKTMKNKLLLSTALIGSIVVADLALAQTTVTGNLAINYRAQENKTAAAGSAGSTRGFGRESQLNIQNKGKLNNGMDYAAGFSLEFDGNDRAPKVIGGTNTLVTQREADTISNENLYVNFISGSTTFHIGVDHIQNITTDVVPMVLPLMDNVAAGIGASATNGVGANPKESFGFGIIQAIPGSGVTASALYVPRNTDFGNGDQTTPAKCTTGVAVTDGFVATGEVVTGCKNSAYEIGLVGADAFGVKGLGFRAFKNKEKSMTAAAADLEGDHYGVSYRTGKIGLGVERYKQNRITNDAVSKDQKSIQYGATYAVNNQISVGLVRAETERDLANAKEEKITSAQIGYNLGPVAISAAASKVEDLGATATAGTDSKEIQFRITTAF